MAELIKIFPTVYGQAERFQNKVLTNFRRGRHEDAVLIAGNVDYDIDQPEDVGKAILDYFS